MYESIDVTMNYCTEIMSYNSYASDAIKKINEYKERFSDGVFIGEVGKFVKRVSYGLRDDYYMMIII